MSETLASFSGAVTCTRAAGVPELTLRGVSAGPAAAPTALAFSAAVSSELPERLQDAIIERVGSGQYRIRSAERAWLISAGAAHLHRDVGAQFYRAIPPRPVPLSKRVFWRAVLGLAASRAGLTLLRVLRR